MDRANDVGRVVERMAAWSIVALTAQASQWKETIVKPLLRNLASALVLGLLVGCSDGGSQRPSAASAAFEEANKIRAGRQEEAIALYTKAIEADPRFAEAYHNRGLSYAEMYDFKNAESDLAKVKELGFDSTKLEQAIGIAKRLKEMSE